jgi:hypothetical protein
MTTRHTCKDCRSFESATDADNAKNGVGWCHRFPPQIYNEGRSATFPPVSREHSWCGEYRRKSGNKRTRLPRR